MRYVVWIEEDDMGVATKEQFDQAVMERDDLWGEVYDLEDEIEAVKEHASLDFDFDAGLVEEDIDHLEGVIRALKDRIESLETTIADYQD